MKDWESFLISYQKTNKRLSFMTFLLIIFTLIMIGFSGFVLYQFNERPIRPMFVGVDSLGNIVKTGQLDDNINIENTKLADVTSWLESCRSYSKDSKINRKWLEKCSAKLIRTSDAYNLVNSFIKRERDTIKRPVSIIVFVKSILETDKNNYLVEWTESHFNDASKIIKRTGHVASIAILYQQSDNPKIFYKNPLGTYIKNLRWSEKQKR